MTARPDIHKALSALVNKVALSPHTINGHSLECEFAEEIVAAREALRGAKAIEPCAANLIAIANYMADSTGELPRPTCPDWPKALREGAAEIERLTALVNERKHLACWCPSCGAAHKVRHATGTCSQHGEIIDPKCKECFTDKPRYDEVYKDGVKWLNTL